MANLTNEELKTSFIKNFKINKITFSEGNPFLLILNNKSYFIFLRNIMSKGDVGNIMRFMFNKSGFELKEVLNAIKEDKYNFEGINYPVKNEDLKLFLSKFISELSDKEIPKWDEWINKTQLWKNKYTVFQPEYKNNTERINSFYFIQCRNSRRIWLIQ